MSQSQFEATIRIEWDRQFGPELRQAKARFLDLLIKEMNVVAQAMESFAKSSHPWTNRTGDAERTFSVKSVGNYTIMAKHGVHYGIYLEYCNGGRYGIIPKTISFGRDELISAVQRAWQGAWRG